MTDKQVYARVVEELVRELIDKAVARHGKAAYRLGMEAGLSHNALHTWKTGISTPKLCHFLWLIEAAGYEFTIRPKEDCQ